jgi:hypothetical protein
MRDQIHLGAVTKLELDRGLMRAGVGIGIRDLWSPGAVLRRDKRMAWLDLTSPEHENLQSLPGELRDFVVSRQPAQAALVFWNSDFRIAELRFSVESRPLWAALATG